MASNAKRSRRIKQRIDPAEKLARQIVPAAQTGRGEFVLRDVANHSDGDQRHSVRSGETKTVARKPKLHKLFDARILNQAGLAACEWYSATYSLGFEAVGITADYGRTGGSPSGSRTHFAKDKAQMLARDEYGRARQSISPMLIQMFEGVVLHGRPLGRLGISFRRAVSQLCWFLEEQKIAA